MMELLASLFAAFYQFGDAFAFLVLSACGLAIIFGMMGVINLAHGEFIMCGAYVTVMTTRAGLPLPLAIISGALVAGLIGMLLERLVIRHLYGRPLDTIVATWGISLIATQGTLILLGSTMQGIGTPLGSFTLGALSFSIYRMVLMLAALAILAGLYVVFNKTRFGILARATIQVPDMAKTLGVNTSYIYALTFGLGAGLAGLAGGLYAPTMTLVPTMGSSSLLGPFLPVVVGGPEAFRGQDRPGPFPGAVKAGLPPMNGRLSERMGCSGVVFPAFLCFPMGFPGLFIKGKG